MNYRLSCHSDRGSGKSIFVLEKEGVEVASLVSASKTDNVKINVLASLKRGLQHARGYLNHKDILIIELQNQHLASWIDGKVESKGYEEELEGVFEVLETVDCRYKVVVTSNSIAKKVMLNRSVSKPKLEDIMEGLED